MVDVIAIGAVSPLGVGDAAWSLGAVGAPARECIREDATLRDAGLKKPWAARAAVQRETDPATALVLAALTQLEGKIPVGRVGVAIGTSSGGMATAERWFATRDPVYADGATYHAPFRAVLARITSLGHHVVRCTHPVTACSASTIAIGLAMRWLEAGEVDLAIAGGYDALTTFVAAGFEALGATTTTLPPRPFRVGRDGMALGEGAGLFLLVRKSGKALAHLSGFGASGDAVHLTAPDREAGGLSRAATRALEGVDPATIDLVSVHGTSTAFNDPMEGKAIAAALGRDVGAVEVHAGKASIGHTLGAAGVLETALAIDALRRGIAPATAGVGELDADVGAAPRSVHFAKPIRAVLKLSAAFGGANAALVIGPSVAREHPHHGVRTVSEVTIAATLGDDLDTIAAASGVAKERLARMDHVCRLALWACGALATEAGSLRGAGVVLGTALATIDVNTIYDENMRKKGASHAEGRRFAYTTPNAAAGECSIAFGLTGPNLAVSRGLDAHEEALEVAHDLVASGDAERMVVVAVDAAGPAALELSRACGWEVTFGARAWLLARE